jgi:hypothetical protein
MAPEVIYKARLEEAIIFFAHRTENVDGQG